jgi:Tfp pilus assembly protein PilX
MNIMRSKKLLKESHCTKTARSQSGSALIISMIILILLMLLGVAAVTTSDTQFKLAGNLQFDDAALNNAETAIAAAEATLADGVTYQDPGLLIARNAATPQFYPMAVLGAQAAPNNDPLTMAWNDTNSTSIAGNSSQRFLIETMSLNDRLIGSTQCTGCRLSSGCNQVNTYRITARGASMRGATKFVQSFYSVLSCPA